MPGKKIMWRDVYLGPSVNLMTPPTWWKRITNKFAKAVLVKLEYKRLHGGAVKRLKLNQTVMLDACVNSIERSIY